MMHFQPSLMSTLERNWKKSDVERMQARYPSLRRPLTFANTEYPTLRTSDHASSNGFNRPPLQRAESDSSLLANPSSSHKIDSSATLPRSVQKSPSAKSPSAKSPLAAQTQAIPRTAQKSQSPLQSMAYNEDSVLPDMTRLLSDSETPYRQPSVRTPTSRSPSFAQTRASPRQDTRNELERAKLEEEWERLRQWDDALTKKDTELSQALEEVMAEITVRDGDVANRERDVSEERQRLQCWSDDLRLKEEDLNSRESDLYRREEELERKERHLAKCLDSFIDKS